MKKFATKEDLNQFVTKEDLKNELKKYATKKDLEKMVKQIVKEMTEIIGSLGEKIARALGKIRAHRIILGVHEERIQEIEKTTLQPGF